MVALAARAYHRAAPLLNAPLTEVVPELTALDALLFHYYGGALLLGLRRYQDAYVFFARALSLPASATSAVAVAAYKKLVLTSFILTGSVRGIACTRG